MKFEISERIKTQASFESLMAALESQFRKIAKSIRRDNQTLVANAIEATFGSINRKSTAIVSLKKVEGGWLTVADVHYRPSFWFWVFFIIGLFTWVFWLLPIIFYLLQRKTVKNAIEECLKRIKNEYDQSMMPDHAVGSSMDDLTKLAALKEKGLVTDGEFDAKKKELLGL